jgi:polyhydroxybutyrate depolymerase
MSKRLQKLFWIVAAAWLGMAAPALAGELEGRIATPDGDRTFTMVVPDGASRGRMPVVVALHGALGRGERLKRTFGLDAVAAQEGFVTVYPNGKRLQWNDGRRPRWGGGSRADDVAFLAALARQLIDDGIADPKRLYLVGVSNGGMMAYRMACEAPGTFTAYTAVVANMPIDVAETCRPGRGVPMLIINGTSDPLVTWDGGPLGRRGKYGELISTADSVAFWARNNGCKGEAQRRPLPDRSEADGSTVVAEQFSDCNSGAPVVLIAIEGGGHVPPGMNTGRPFTEMILGKPNRDVSAADLAWKFFKRFPERR